MSSKTDQQPTAEDLRCHLCHQPSLEEFAAFRDLRRVTSDCRSWPAGGRLCLCSTCGSLQKIVDDEWRREVDSIYASYCIYHQAAGVEQAIFEQTSGAALPRSLRMLQELDKRFRLPKTGRMLDIGCGNGATLRAFHEIAPCWSLVGSDLDAKERAAVEGIEGVERLFTCSPDQISGFFDLITMVHVLEHIANPEAFLASLQPKIAPGGMLLVEVPDHARNPFELVVADHCTHFTAESITALLQRSGYEPAMVTGEWIEKELSTVATPSQNQGATVECRTPSVLMAESLSEDGSQSRGQVHFAAKTAKNELVADGSGIGRKNVNDALAWLKSVAAAARDLAQTAPLGLFGTSIAAIWLFGELEGAAAFFVDEDPNRVGRKLFGCPVYRPNELVQGSRVFVAMPPAQADSICRRLAVEGVAFHCPPPLPSGAMD